MSNKIYNFCPYCGKRIPKFNTNKTYYCCFCGLKLKKRINSTIKKVQCTVCHIFIDSNKYKTIKCSYCGSVYHSTCVSSWLLKYNACPMCQNVFILPNKILNIK